MKKIAVLNDLSGLGKCSLTAAIPVISVMGIQACPLPTAVLSCQTGFPSYFCDDYTDRMDKFMDEWKNLDFQPDGIYTGFLADAAQADKVVSFIEQFGGENVKILVDPVMGDDGEEYPIYTEALCEKMRFLVKRAAVITPNLTELFYLLDEPYKADSTDEELKEYLRLLSDKGPQVVIITSVPVHDEPHKTSVYAYNRQGNRYWKVTCPYLPAHYPGTGDTFTSVITGSLMQGDSLPMALDRATQFILQGIRATFGYEYDNREGILLEKVLHNLDMPIQMASYELI